MKNLRIGIVGLGSARRGHMKRFQSEKETCVTAIFDSKKTGKYQRRITIRSPVFMVSTKYW